MVATLPDFTPEQLAAIEKGKRLKAEGRLPSQLAKQADEVLPPATPMTWAVSDPACLIRLVDAAIESDGDIAFAAKRLGCPEDVSYALQNSSEWTATFEKRCHFLITLKGRVKALKALSDKVEQDGNAYTFKVLHDTAPKEDLSEDEKRRMTAFSGMTRAELRDEVARHQAIMQGYQERLSAGKSPPPAAMQAVIEDVIGPMLPLPTTTEEWEAQNPE